MMSKMSALHDRNDVQKAFLNDFVVLRFGV